MKNRQEIDAWLQANYKTLDNPEFYFGIDNNQMKVEDFEKADFRILVAFLSTGMTRSVSNTFNAISTQATLGNEGVFIDYAYFPEETNIPILEANDIPFMFGNVSHAPVQDYDFIIMSHSIMPEAINIPRVLMGSGIPLTTDQRMKDNTIPLIAYGGAAANENGLALGKLYDDNGEYLGKSLIDMAQYGYAEGVMHVYINYLMNLKKQGFNMKDKMAVINKLIDDEVCKGKLFFPQFYEWVYAEDNFTIKEIKCLDDRLPKVVDYNRISDKELDHLGWDYKTFNVNGESCTSVDMQCSSGCSGQSSVCSFCMEATVAGGYHEITLDKMVERMKAMKMNCAPNTSSLFSYNVNYYYKFMDIIKEQAANFSGISLLNERLDVVANAPEQLKLAKVVGLKRFSGAIEGMGERVRNKIFNKNLDRATLMKAVENIMDLKLMHMKAGMILTGLETKEDEDDFISELREILEIRKRKGANTSLQFNFTPLVLYSQIALRHLPRKSAENSYNEVKNKRELLDRVRQLSEEYQTPVRCKFNGKGCGTYVEQLMIDFGPAGTTWLVNCVKDGLKYNGFFSKKDGEIVKNNLTKLNYDHLFFTQARPKDWIFPTDHIAYATKEVKEEWWKRTEEMDFERKLCLKTLANPNPKCYGCKSCEPSHIKYMVNRPMDDKTKVEDIIEYLSTSRTVDTTRIVFTVPEKYQFVSKKMLSHYIMSKFLQADPELVDKFYKIDKYSNQSVFKNGQKDWFYGTFSMDVAWKENIPYGSLDELVAKVNSQLDTCQVKTIYYNVSDQKSTNNQFISYVGTLSNYSFSKLRDKYLEFDWDVKVAVKAMGTDLTTAKKLMPEIKDDCLFVPYKDKIMFSMVLPTGVNPHLVLSSLLSRPYKFILQNTSIQVTSFTQPLDVVCKCGNPIHYNLLTNKPSKMCPRCENKIRLKLLSSK